MALLAVVSPAAATLVKKPVTKHLGHGAIWQDPLSKRSCYGSDAKAKLLRQHCTVIAQMKGADITVRPVVAPDSRAVYIAAQGGVLVLKRATDGTLSFDSCLQVAGPCGPQDEENGEGSTVLELALGPDSRQLYMLLDRQRYGGTEIHALAIGAGDRLGPDPSCLLLMNTADPDVPVANPRNCRMTRSDNYTTAYGLALTPNGRFAYVMNSSRSATNIVEMSRGADGDLTVLPGCVSATGGIGDYQPGACQTTTPVGQGSDQILNLKQLAVAPDSSSLIVRGDDTDADTLGGFFARFAIDGAGGLARSAAAAACVNATGANGCARTPALLSYMSSIAVLGSRVYVGTATLRPPEDRGIFASNVLGFQLAADGGLSLPAGAAGCVGNLTVPFVRIKPLGKCAMGREAMRHPALVLAGPRGSLYALGYISGDGRGIAPIRLSASGAPSAIAGPSGCLLGNSIFTKEKTPCNHPFTADTLPGSEDTLSFTPDGRAAYVLKQVQAADTIQLNVLARRP